MPAYCTNSKCEWVGSPLKVVDKKCPECDEPITYHSRELVADVIRDAVEFNRRAFAALERCNLSRPDIGFVGAVRQKVGKQRPMSEEEQAKLFSIVNRYGVHDRAVATYAAHHAKGAD